MTLVKKLPSHHLESIPSQLNWQRLDKLPNTKVKFIKDVAGEIFNDMEMGPLSEIKYLHLGRSLASKKSIVQFLTMIKDEGKLIRESTLEFNGPLQGHSAEIQVWSHLKKKYLIVSDQFGSYIYCN